MLLHPGSKLNGNFFLRKGQPVLREKMPQSCSASNCKNKYQRESCTAFYRFPLKNKSLLEKWVSAVNREGFVPNKLSALCDQHFKPTSFRYVLGRKHLKENQVPTVFECPEQSQNLHDTAPVVLPKVVHVKLFVPSDESDKESNTDEDHTERPEPTQETVPTSEGLPRKSLFEDDNPECSLWSEETEDGSTVRLLSSASLPNIDTSQIPLELLRDPSYQTYLLYKASISKSLNMLAAAQPSAIKAVTNPLIVNHRQVTEELKLKKKMNDLKYKEHFELQNLKRKYERKCKQTVDLRRSLKTAHQKIRRLNKTLTDLASAIEGLDKVAEDINVDDDGDGDEDDDNDF